MINVFVIIEGEYSDWRIVGYADTELNAENICNEHNSKQHFYDWYYEEIKYLDKPDKVIEMRYVFEFILEFIDGKYHVRYGFGKWPFLSLYNENNLKYKHVTLDNNVYKPRLYVPMKEKDYDKASKIARDYIAEYNYEHLVGGANEHQQNS